MKILDAWKRLNRELELAESDVLADLYAAPLRASHVRGDMTNWYARNGPRLVEIARAVADMRDYERNGLDVLASAAKDLAYERLDEEER